MLPNIETTAVIFRMRQRAYSYCIYYRGFYLNSLLGNECFNVICVGVLKQFPIHITPQLFRMILHEAILGQLAQKVNDHEIASCGEREE